jgi:hypothetical protein
MRSILHAHPRGGQVQMGLFECLGVRHGWRLCEREIVRRHAGKNSAQRCRFSALQTARLMGTTNPGWHMPTPAGVA